MTKRGSKALSPPRKRPTGAKSTRAAKPFLYRLDKDQQHRLDMYGRMLGKATAGDAHQLLAELAAIRAFLGRLEQGFQNNRDARMAMLVGFVSDLATFMLLDFSDRYGKKPAKPATKRK